MCKELEMAKKLTVLGWIYRKKLISDDEYKRAKQKIMNEYGWMGYKTK